MVKYTDIGRFLKLWRMNQGVKLETVAAELGVSVATWDHWETGRRRPNLDNLIAVAGYLRMPPQCLLCERTGMCVEEGQTRLCDR